MKIYMVREYIPYGEYDIIGAYLNEEDAEAHVVRAQAVVDFGEEYSVEEWEVN